MGISDVPLYDGSVGPRGRPQPEGEEDVIEIRAPRIGCQTYTWEMLGDGWGGGPDDLLAAIAAGGYAGIEITDNMIGDYGRDAARFAEALSRNGLDLVALAVASPSGFTRREALDDDLETCRRWADHVARFSGALIALGSATRVGGVARAEAFDVCAEFYNRAAEIGRQAGVEVAVHPSSHAGTLLFDRADYDRLFAALDPGVGWIPDTGHMLRAGQDMADTLRAHCDRIRHLHLKDVDATGDWAMLGAGVCDTPEVFEILRAAPGFTGWLVIEEESAEAARDPSAAVKRNRETLRAML